MNTHRFLLIILLQIIISSAIAGNITKKQALKVANNFYVERIFEFGNATQSDNVIDGIFEREYNSKTVYYTINYKEGGWVTVSATAIVKPIIAYSYTGKYQLDFEPDNHRAWMNQYAIQISDAIYQQKTADNETALLWNHYLTSDANDLEKYQKGRSVEPLVITSWDQGMYYNEMCPDDPSGPGGHCLTGCVPTCMGQIANYFRWPETGVGEYSYDGGAYGTLSANFGESYYNWNEMPVSVTNNSLETAQILYHFGVSCDLVYGPNGSGMYNHKAAYALRTHFKYSPETVYLYRDSTNLNWDSVIIAHLDKKIPLYYAGWSVPNINGHAFVCDGYENDNFFHFNWGWSGSYDGYFYTDNLNPGGSNFNLAQELIINCFPDTNAYAYPVYNTSIDTMTAIMGTIDDGSGPVYNYLDNLNAGWLISPEDSIVNISLEFHRLNISAGDTLYIYDGNSNGSPLITALSGNDIPDIITSSGIELYLEFITDNETNAEGWIASYTSELSVYCSGNTFITEPSGELSDGSGDANYHNLTTCIWLINPGTDEDIVLEFTDFDTEPEHDFLTIYDGSNQVGAFSGNELPDNITATEGGLTLVFSTNSSITAQGWNANYYTIPVSIEEPVTEDQIVNIYPIPANDYFTIESISKIVSIEMYNSFGFLVYTSNAVNDTKIDINISNLQSGMYIVKIEIETENEMIMKEVLIR